MSMFNQLKETKATGSSYASAKLKQAEYEHMKYAKVIPTGIEVLDSMITEPFSNIGGLPIGKGKITLLAGDPGSGKSRLGINLATTLLKNGSGFMYVGFEFEPEEFVGQVYQQYKHIYGANDVPLHKLYSLDYHSTVFKASSDINNIASQATEFKKVTGSPFVFIDSVTEMTTMETMLRSTLDKLNKAFYLTGEDFAVIGVSQYRGSYDKGIAGGKGMSHKGTAVMVMESEEVNNFNRKYMPERYDYGRLVRTVRVIKTANYAHSLNRHVFEIDEYGVLQFTGEILTTMANNKVRN